MAALCVVVQLRVARGSPRALHAVHAAAAFNIWQVATPSRSREGCAFDRASLPRATFTSYFSLLSIVKKNIIVLTRTRRRWSALVLPCTEVATFGADNAAHNQSLAPASAIEAASASPVLPLLPCTTATASVVMKGHAFVVCERRPPPSTDGGDGRHSCRCESRAGRCSQATPSSLRRRHRCCHTTVAAAPVSVPEAACTHAHASATGLRLYSVSLATASTDVSRVRLALLTTKNVRQKYRKKPLQSFAQPFIIAVRELGWG